MSEETVEESVRRGYARFNGAEREPPDEKELASLDVWHPDGVYVNLFVGSTINLENVAGTDVEMVQATDYPWSGKLALTVKNRGKAFVTLKGCCGNHGQPGC